MKEEQIRQIFKDNFDCYTQMQKAADDIYEVPAMTEDKFVELINSHISPVMSSRFDEAIEKVMGSVEWGDHRDRKEVYDLFQKMLWEIKVRRAKESAISHRKISET